MTAVRDLFGAIEDCFAAAPSARPVAFRALVSLLKEAVRDGRVVEAIAALRRAIDPALDYTAFQTLFRIYRSLPAEAVRATKKVAVFGSSTTEHLAKAVELALFSMGGAVEIVEADYGVYRQELLDPASNLYERKPDAIFLATGWRDLAHRPGLECTQDDVARLVDAEYGEWAVLWRAAHERIGCQIIQNNFDCPAWRQLGNHDGRHPGGLARYIHLVNQALADRTPPYVVIHDLDELSAAAGRNAWGDERFYYHAKLPCPPRHLVDYGFSVASLLAANMGLTKKCLVLDLDNTLWGGIIGDDGLGGIRLGQGDGEGEAFLSFQRYAKSLKERGILLAVCSKNTEHIAKEPFEKHPEMALRLDDISCFVANWNDKAANLREIARTLNIGLDALVLADDNPAERALVRQLAPEVAVPELPADPADFIQAIERHRYFQITSLAGEDLQRADYYRENSQRQQVLGSSEDVEQFLDSLEMVATIAPVDLVSLERTVQLINKSNQFNLTTRRRTAAEVLTLINDPAWFAGTVSLRDRFGDNGLISVVLARRDADCLSIDTWLMSCRVLKRGVETLVHNCLCRWARDRGLRAIRGEYIPTAKNGLVKSHFEGLGYSKVGEGPDGHTCWEFRIADEWSPAATHIKEIDLSRP